MTCRERNEDSEIRYWDEEKQRMCIRTADPIVWTTDQKNESAKGMTTETFNKLLDELDGNSLETLKQKNAKYASPTDCLHNFDSGADIMGSTPAQCAWGYMTKHLVALRDKVQKNDFSDRDDLLEKCQDIINYIRFIWLIGNETETKKKVD